MTRSRVAGVVGALLTLVLAMLLMSRTVEAGDVPASSSLAHSVRAVDTAATDCEHPGGLDGGDGWNRHGRTHHRAGTAQPRQTLTVAAMGHSPAAEDAAPHAGRPDGRTPAPTRASHHQRGAVLQVFRH
ncbi:hypothetical protein [Streptomyces sp. ISL-11]|uniref:hypothetical protein n=1 Tax=Streptomyces sp. ISL-11 TaxID=2819174 RepID=UPI001BE81A53|nr:hypothetical protein [Streptomyces sp. ISL-11]MBT2386935.1 hypothetical protein [Streptomyces sp. ISL-11]